MVDGKQRVRRVSSLELHRETSDMWKKAKAVVHLGSISQGLATKIRVVSPNDADRALRSAFMDYTRHEVARLRDKLSTDRNLNAKLRNRLAAKLKTAEKDLKQLEDVSKTEEEAEAQKNMTKEQLANLEIKKAQAGMVRSRTQLNMTRSNNNNTTAALLRNRLARKLQLVDAELTARNKHDVTLIEEIAKMDDMLGQLLRKVQSEADNDTDKSILAFGKAKNAVVMKTVTATAHFKEFLDNYLRNKGYQTGGGGPPPPPPPGMDMPRMEETRDGQNSLSGDEGDDEERQAMENERPKKMDTITAHAPRKIMVIN